MSRKGLLVTMVLCGAIAAVTTTVCAAEPLADELLSRWRDGLQPLTRVSMSLRMRRTNDLFGDERAGAAVYFRQGRNRWAMRIGLNADAPVSALRPQNGQKPMQLMEPFEIISTPDGVCVGNGRQYEWCFCEPVSARAPKNVPSWSYMMGNIGENLMAALADDASMPLFLPESADFTSFEVLAVLRPNGDQWLTLRPARNTEWARRFHQVDVVFRADEMLPVAIRIIGSYGSDRSHFYFDDIRSGDDALIPVDAFQLQGRMISCSPQSPNHGRIP